MLAIEGAVQHYAWGDVEAIPALVGRPPDGRPWAELWLGTHPGGPTSVTGADGVRRGLIEVTGPLPFLFKLLAAAEPLSLQIHPGADTARREFAAEQSLAGPPQGRERLYRDPYAKPEVLCALGPFEVLCGFRPIAASLELLTAMRHPVCTALADRLSSGGLRRTLREILVDRRFDVGEITAACAADEGHGDPATAAVAGIARRWPGDPALGAAILLNHRVLQAGQAVYLSAGVPHAYLRGLGVELMGPSDNVLRVGFTAKHIDIDAVLEMIDVQEMAEPMIEPAPIAPGIVEYPTPTPDWCLRRVDVDGRIAFSATALGMLLCVAGTTAELPGGATVLVVPGERVELTGRATVYWATAR